MLALYTIIALAMNFDRALPLAVLELLALALVAGGALLKRASSSSSPLARAILNGDERDRTLRNAASRRPRALAALAVACHLCVIAALSGFAAERWWPVLGMALIVLGCYAGSKDRGAIRWRPVAAGLALQFWLSVLLLRTSFGLAAVRWTASQVSALLGFAGIGAAFVLCGSSTGFVGCAMPLSSFWAFIVLSVTIFFASLCSVLLHVGVLQVVFGRLGGALSALLGVSRAEAICAVANIFLGQTEAPLLVRPILGRLNDSQLHCVMAGGFASVAGSTLGAYILMGAPATHLLAACPGEASWRSRARRAPT